jgi:hypothetical protein
VPRARRMCTREVRRRRGRYIFRPVGEEIRLRPLSEEEQPKGAIEQVILLRGSTRTFDKAASITLSQLSTILDCAREVCPLTSLNLPDYNSTIFTYSALGCRGSGREHISSGVIEKFSMTGSVD